MNQCNATETAACCCMDVGTVMDNSDCLASFSHEYASQAQAQQALETLTAKAREVESDPCQITSQVTRSEQGVRLDADFLFACQAEALIFQLGLR